MFSFSDYMASLFSDSTDLCPVDLVFPIVRSILSSVNWRLIPLLLQVEYRSNYWRAILDSIPDEHATCDRCGTMKGLELYDETSMFDTSYTHDAEQTTDRLAQTMTPCSAWKG